MRDPQPMVTIVVATLNSADRLPRCLDSVAAQSYPRREVVVKDGGSKDGTRHIVQSHGALVTHWESSPDRGVYDAWNQALPHVHGEWVCFLGADDYLWSPTALQLVVQAAAVRRSETRLLSGRVAVVNRRGEVLLVAGRPWRRGGRASLRWPRLPNPGMFHHRSVFQDFGNFDPSFRLAGDYDLLVRVLRFADVESIPEVITGMELGGISSATSAETEALREIARVWRKSGLARFPTPTWWWLYGEAAGREWMRRAFGEQAVGRILDLIRRAKGMPAFWTRR
jgi:glycosyltransferase involved in cell wall biosynthesis